jgi:chorismate dehydratase
MTASGEAGIFASIYSKQIVDCSGKSFAIISYLVVSRMAILFRGILIFLALRRFGSMKIRVSLVHFLNSAPLGWAFLHGPFRDKFDVRPSSPAMCADQLSSGEADIGLIPSIEYQRIPDLRILPDISISSLGEVRSILLVRPKDKPAIRTVALDTSSRTSVALAKILLHSRMGIRPEFVPHQPDLARMLSRCDAALLIGDAALQVRIEEYDATDLAGEWGQWQRKPFVYAFWACRPGISYPSDLCSVFLEAKEWGLKRRDEIAAVYASSLNLSGAFLEDYLNRNIDFDLTPRHIDGLQQFYGLAKLQDLIPEVRDLLLYSSRSNSTFQ